MKPAFLMIGEGIKKGFKISNLEYQDIHSFVFHTSSESAEPEIFMADTSSGFSMSSEMFSWLLSVAGMLLSLLVYRCVKKINRSRNRRPGDNTMLSSSSATVSFNRSSFRHSTMRSINTTNASDVELITFASNINRDNRPPLGPPPLPPPNQVDGPSTSAGYMPMRAIYDPPKSSVYDVKLEIVQENAYENVDEEAPVRPPKTYRPKRRAKSI